MRQLSRLSADLSGQGNHVTDRRTRIELNPLKQVARHRPRSFAIARDRPQLCSAVAISNHKFPSKLLFTHFMFATLALRSIKCG
jgi:hypothetical protein